MATDAPQRTVVVTGDLVVDVSVIRSPVRLSYHAQALRTSALKLRVGGAWFLRELVETVCADLTNLSAVGPEVPDIVCAREENPYPQAFQVWHRCPRVTGKSKDDVWRIDEFLGCKPAPDDAPPPEIMGDIHNPSLLVIDDLGLGFINNPAHWPAALRDGGCPDAVVVKANSLPDQGPFWTRLREMEDRVTVILTSGTLRESGVRLPQPLSWDLAVEDIRREFSAGGLAHEHLSSFKRVIVRLGLEGAASLTRHALRWPHKTASLLDELRFERLLYLPESLPDDLKTRMPGGAFGATSILTAAVVRHELGERRDDIVIDYPLFIALGRGLQAARKSHEIGGGKADKNVDPDAALTEIGKTLTWREDPDKRNGKDADGNPEPAAAFYSAFDHDTLDANFRPDDPTKSDLLADASGSKQGGLLTKAIEVVLRGTDSALAAAPRARYEKYVTADRDEIERINAVRNLIQTYVHSDSDRRPLSIAVFGPPGAGKSFAIKNLAKVLFPEGPAKLEFNLSQMSESDLTAAFQQVRDASIRKQLPFVFWDEFDTENLKWLKYFLAPMQDAEFNSEGSMHPLGKCIFVFAGGTCHTFDGFDKKKRQDGYDAFVEHKGPDFVSRLRGYLNVKGPNPVGSQVCPVEAGAARAVEPTFDERARQDPQYLIRRAIILRSAIEEFFFHLVEACPDELPLCPKLVRAFLASGDFTHGARSISTIVAMSTVDKALYYNSSQLPAEDFVRMHNADLLDHLNTPELEAVVTEELARACHTFWLVGKVLPKADAQALLAQPYETVLEGVASPEFASQCKAGEAKQKPYDLLPKEDLKELSRRPARQTPAKLAQADLTIERASQGNTHPLLPDDEAALDPLYLAEHDSWMRDYLLKGFEYADAGDLERLRLHWDIAPFGELRDDHGDYDRVIVASIFAALGEHGYVVVHK